MARFYRIVDGGRRHRAALIAGLKEVPCVLLKTVPTPSESRLLDQLSIDVHRANLTPMERSDALARLMRENNWSVSELAERVSMKQPLVSKLLKFQDGCPEVRGALAAGQIDQDKAYTICQEPDHAKQVELLAQSGDLTREQLRQKARSKGQPLALKTSVARFALPKGIMVTVQGPRIDLAAAIEALLATARVLKKGEADSWDIVTAARVMKDRARAAS